MRRAVTSHLQKKSPPIKNMPDPLLRSYCCSKQVLFKMCSRNSRTTVTIQKLFGDVDQSHRLATKDPITYNLVLLHLIQPLFLSLSPPPLQPPCPVQHWYAVLPLVWWWAHNRGQALQTDAMHKEFQTHSEWVLQVARSVNIQRGRKGEGINT